MLVLAHMLLLEGTELRCGLEGRGEKRLALRKQLRCGHAQHRRRLGPIATAGKENALCVLWVCCGGPQALCLKENST